MEGESRGEKVLMLFLVRSSEKFPRLPEFSLWGSGRYNTNVHLPRFAATTRNSFCLFIGSFFPLYIKISSTLSFSQELTDKNRKAQWILILELSSEAKGKI